MVNTAASQQTVQVNTFIAKRETCDPSKSQQEYGQYVAQWGQRPQQSKHLTTTSALNIGAIGLGSNLATSI